VYQVGVCYDLGIGVETDKQKAFAHYQKLADMNNSNRTFQVGFRYYNEIGVE
jgi:TPR repeat protein